MEVVNQTSKEPINFELSNTYSFFFLKTNLTDFSALFFSNLSKSNLLGYKNSGLYVDTLLCYLVIVYVLVSLSKHTFLDIKFYDSGYLKTVGYFSVVLLLLLLETSYSPKVGCCNLLLRLVYRTLSLKVCYSVHIGPILLTILLYH